LLLDDQRVGIATEGHDPKTTYYPMGFFEGHARGKERNFPNSMLIEPRYLGFAPNDDHPPHDPFNGQRLIAKIYNAIRANEALWKTTLFLVVYDEHGGFADHDHTSLLRSLIEKWGPQGLGGRAAQATDIFAALQRAPAVRSDTPKKIGLELPGESSSPAPPTSHQQAVEHLAASVDQTSDLTPLERAARFFGGAPPGIEAP
jgi:hypothetical protein